MVLISYYGLATPVSSSSIRRKFVLKFFTNLNKIYLLILSSIQDFTRVLSLTAIDIYLDKLLLCGRDFAYSSEEFTHIKEVHYVLLLL